MADTLKDIAGGAAAGSSFGPWGAGIGAAIGGIGSLLGGNAEEEAAKKAKEEYAIQAQKGIDTLKTGRGEAVSNATPYIKAGQEGAAGTVDLIKNRTQAAQPTQTVATSQNALDNYLNPSAAYTTRIANDQIQAKALASGAAGGGMLKALSDNANKMAMTNYNNAYDQMLKSNDQTFGQGQQLYSNKTAYDQSQILNNQNLMNSGAGATANLANTNLQYDSNLNQGYENLGSSNAGGTMVGGNIAGQTIQNLGNIAGQAAQTVIPAVGDYLSKYKGED